MEDSSASTVMELAPPSLGTRQLKTLQRVKTQAVRGAARAEWLMDSVVWGLRKRFGKLGELKIVAYRGYGTPRRIQLKGRILEDTQSWVPQADDSLFTNLRYMFRRFNSNEVPEVQVRAAFSSSSVTGTTDDEGYFNLDLALDDSPRDANGWQRAEFEVVGSTMPGWQPVRGSAEVLIPSPEAEFVIVSDIDDTVLQTYVNRRLKMLWVTLSGSAFTRSTFEGTSDWYQALVRGTGDHGGNPIFYVSKSPWNLYDFLIDFMDRKQLPRGPLLLRDIGLNDQPPLDFKAETIEQLFATYPSRQFVLIGDSGERDPDIYLELAEKYPGRVRSIYIRKLNSHMDRTLDSLREHARQLGTELFATSSAEDALAHSREHGLIA
ncbi:MAG TPA: phosphatase domain-containing protein [Polyangiaceae bacterium]|jgi:phosphatidate phosphatase APP1|nr:phosphatase domain-containing protein [Polyangiaceae bacterium]